MNKVKNKKKLSFILLIMLVFFLFLSCSNDKKANSETLIDSIGKNKTSSKTIDTKLKTQEQIEDTLSQIDIKEIINRMNTPINIIQPDDSKIKKYLYGKWRVVQASFQPLGRYSLEDDTLILKNYIQYEITEKNIYGVKKWDYKGLLIKENTFNDSYDSIKVINLEKDVCLQGIDANSIAYRFIRDIDEILKSMTLSKRTSKPRMYLIFFDIFGNEIFNAFLIKNKYLIINSEGQYFVFKKI